MENARGAGSTEYLLTDADMDHVRSNLRRNAQLFDRPHAYMAGIEDAVAALIAIGRDPDRDVIRMPDVERGRHRTSRMI